MTITLTIQTKQPESVKINLPDLENGVPLNLEIVNAYYEENKPTWSKENQVIFGHLCSDNYLINEIV